MKLKVNHDKCIMCGACVYLEESKFEIEDKVIAKGDYDKELAKEIIDICPVEAISEA